MVNLEQIKKEVGSINCESWEFENQIIEAFGDYNYQGETEVIVTYPAYNVANAYINHSESPVIVIEFEKEIDDILEEQWHKVTKVY